MGFELIGRHHTVSPLPTRVKSPITPLDAPIGSSSATKEQEVFSQEQNLESAIKRQNLELIKSLLAEGRSFSDKSLGKILLSMPQKEAVKLIREAQRQGIIPKARVQELLMPDIYLNYKTTVQDREKLIRLGNIPFRKMSADMYNKVRSSRIQRFQAPPSPTEQALLKKIEPVWRALSTTHKTMIQQEINTFGERWFRHINVDPSSQDWVTTPAGLRGKGWPFIHSIPNIGVDDLFSGAHFFAGVSTVPRLLGVVKALEIMSKSPQKTYRWFTQSKSTGEPAYHVPNFFEKFPKATAGVYLKEGYLPKLASNVTDEFSLAMNTLKERNNNTISKETLDKADIGFTVDNGDAHDVACHIRFHRDPKSGNLTGVLTVVDSVPKHIAEKKRPGQDQAYKEFGSLVQAYFSSVLGWPSESVPKMKTRVIYMNNQVNGYCTSNAIDHLLAPGLNPFRYITHPTIPGWTTTLKKSADNTLVPENANSIFFIGRTREKLKQARLALHLSDVPSEKSPEVLEGLAQIDRAMQMDLVNSVEGRSHDYHETRPTARAWRNMVADAEKKYDQDPFLQQHFKNKTAYTESVIARSVLTPVRIDNRLRLMDARDWVYHQAFHNLKSSNTTSAT